MKRNGWNVPSISPNAAVFGILSQLPCYKLSLFNENFEIHGGGIWVETHHRMVQGLGLS